ncbi:DUF1778 domain-containing protein [Methylocystis sp. JR02]|uniref:type II toxin-antitoxin system TacA family antitoxin n=1 Tax=Methylocystis sp. JR02 TaxID=3046284 RepID=UPI0024BAE49D|nr:DUF1778 domain-containing protein [Methylocystis sp. JR02]MDJ0448746.1 DUF1778 domain-containing protein [Methylocystis sp. JR02]
MAQATKTSDRSRRGLVNVRMAAEDRNIIDRAAKAAGKTRTEFMVEAARRAAQETLLDANLIVVDAKTFERFRKIFDAPAKPNEGLRKLMNLKAPWEN